MKAPHFAFASRRPDTYAARHVVSTSSGAASAAALLLLEQGGNAVDACVAAAAVLAVDQPTSTGVGGDAFCLVWSEREKKVVAAVA